MASGIGEAGCRVLDEIKMHGSLKPRDVARRFNVATETVWRWMTRGVISKEGQRVKLGSVKLGSGLFTAEPALARFAESLVNSDVNTEPMRSPSAHRRASESAERQLQSLGC
ncbi:MAG: hypothetical protein LC104_06640 [Bacteroidales bacterium]|nr:hypothetical protein [Bacteroidales bacterium]